MKITLYVCGTDPTDIELGAKDIKFYMSINQLKKDRPCTQECGIVAYDVELGEAVVAQMPLPHLSVENTTKGDTNG